MNVGSEEAISMPDGLRQALDAVESRRRRLLVVARLAEIVVASVALLALIMVWDAFVQPGGSARRLVTLAAATALVAGIVVRLVLPLWRRRDHLAIARSIEARRPDLREGLSSAIAFVEGADPRASRWMVARTVALAAQQAGTLEASRLISPRPARRRLGWASLALAVLAVVLATPSGASWCLRAVMPWLPTVRPSPYRIVVKSSTTLVPRGAPYLIEARIEPEPREVHADLWWEDGVRERLRLGGSGSRFALDLPAVTRAFRYRIVADGGESVELSVGVVDAPVVEEVLVTISPPAYTDLPSRTTAAGDLEVVAGSRIGLALRGGSGLRGAVLTRDGEPDKPFGATADGDFQARFLADMTRTWGIRLIGDGGLVVEPSAHWLLTVRPDAAPRVDLDLIQGMAAVAGVDESLLVRARAVDDHGLRGIEMVLSNRDGEIERRDLLAGRDGAPRTVDRFESVAIAQHGLGVGDVLRIRLEAIDQGGLRSVGEDLAVRIVSDPVAESARLALRLRTIIAATERMLADLRTADRTWAGLQRTYRADDPASQRGELLLLGAKLDQICDRTAQSGLQVRDLGVATNASVGPRLLVTGDALRAWGLLQRRILAKSLALATAQGRAEDIQRSRDLTDSAVRSLEPLRSGLMQIVARLEVEALVAATERGLGSVQAAVPVLAGIESWRQPLRQPGLLLSVFAGTEVTGDVVRRVAAPPTLAAVMEAGRTEQVSARWEGEVRIPKTGRYRFQVTVDDGARLAVAGSQLLPAEAWSWQAPTPYQGSADLEEGWCDLVIEFRQGGGGAAFEVVWALADESFTPLASADLRCRIPGASDDEVLAAMLSASPAAAALAETSVREALAVGSLIDERLEAIALETGRDRIQALAKAARKDAQALREVAKTAPGGSAVAEDVAGHLTRLLRVVNLAREHLRDAVDKVGQAGDPLGVERAMLRELVQRGDALKAIPTDLPEADRLAAVRREVTAAQAIAEALAVRLTEIRQDLLNRVRSPDPILAERLALLEARSGVASIFTAGDHALSSLRTLPGDAAAARSAIATVCADLDRRLERVNSRLVDAGEVRLGHLVDSLVAAMPGWESGFGQTPLQRERLHAAADSIVAHLRRSGRAAIALQVRAGCDDLIQRQSGDTLRRRLKDLGSRPGPMPVPWDQAVGDGERALALLDVVEAGSADADERLDQAREELRAIAATLGIIQGPSFPTSVAQRDHARVLAEDAEMLALSLEPNLPVAQDIVEGIRHLAAEADPAEAAAESEGLLADLARHAQAALADPNLRPSLQERLAIQARGRSVPGPDRDRLLATVDDLEEGLGRERRLVRSEERERLDFAAVEQATADALDGASRALEARDGNGDQSVVQALARAGSDARRRAELARASATLPGAESIDLASAARQAGDAVRAGPMRALAETALAVDPIERLPLAEIALSLADALQAQDLAAERLAASAIRREVNRTVLASGRSDIIGWYVGSEGEGVEDATMNLRRQADRVLGLVSTAPPEELIAALGEAVAAHQAWATGGQSRSPQALAQVTEDLHRLRRVASDLAAVGDPDIRQQARSLAVQAHQAIMRLTQDLPSLAEHVVGGVLADPDLAVGRPAPAAPGVVAEAAAILDGAAEDAAWRQVASILDRAVVNAAGTGSVGAAPSASTSAVPTDPDPLLIEAVSGDDQADWLRSRGEIRGDLRSDGAEAFAEEHRAAIRAYFQRLGGEGGR